MIRFYKFSGIFAPVLLFITIIVFSTIYPNYSHLSQTISEINARGVENSEAMNIFYTIGFGLLLIWSYYFIQKKEVNAYLTGFLMLIAFLLMIFLNWFFPMDPWEGVRTASDQVHNNIITLAVCIFLTSQILMAKHLDRSRQIELKNTTVVLFFISFVFGILSLWSNVTHSELINIAERGWMVCFLLYIVVISMKYKIGTKS